MRKKVKRSRRSIIKLINTHQAKSTLSNIIRDIEENDSIVQICRNGKPIVELRRIGGVIDPTEVHPEISKVVFYENPINSVDDRDWPIENR